MNLGKDQVNQLYARLDMNKLPEADFDDVVNQIFSNSNKFNDEGEKVVQLNDFIPLGVLLLEKGITVCLFFPFPIL